MADDESAMLPARFGGAPPTTSPATAQDVLHIRFAWPTFALFVGPAARVSGPRSGVEHRGRVEDRPGIDPLDVQDDQRA